MKTLILTILLATGSAFAMPNIPDGNYEGKASWKDSQDNKGTYGIKIKVENRTIKSTYNYGTHTIVYEFSVSADGNGFFTVQSGGKEVGNGYCMNVQCHYKAVFGDVEMQETLTFWQGNLYRVGSKKVNGHTIAWEEATQKMER